MASGILLILIMVVIGGMTRLTHSGLSMVHWSFTGSLPPLNESEWIAEFERYQQSPEFKELHSHFEIAEFKSIFWWEFIHRFFGRLIGIIFIVPFGYFLYKKAIPKPLLPQFFVILALGGFQAFLGWFMVKSGLVDVPRVSHFRLAAHLITAFLTCSYILWVLLNYCTFGNEENKRSPFAMPINSMFILVVLQIIYGAFVAGLRAGWIHNTWPLMDGQLMHESATNMSPIWKNFMENGSGVQFIHRTLALVLLGIGIWLGFFSELSKTQHLKRPAQIFATLVLLQVVLGILTLLLSVPILLGIAHQVTALLLLLSVIWLKHRSMFSGPIDPTE